MKTVLLLHGPNLNMLGVRQPEIYGRVTLDEIQAELEAYAATLDLRLLAYQSNHEGGLIDYIQQHYTEADGLIINPGALTHYGLSLRDCLAALQIPKIEVHLSNIYTREEWRHKSVIAPVVTGQLAGFGRHGYRAALDLLSRLLSEQK
jgi:3-dehydroquinate dehydratase-2